MAGRYELKIKDEIQPLEWQPGEGIDQARVKIGGAEYAVSFQAVDDHQYLLMIDGRPITAFVARGVNGTHVFIGGRVYRVQETEPIRDRKQRVGLGETTGEVTPPMPALVVRILIKEGEAVVKGQGLVVVSAMKMETTLKAPFDGTVKKINTALQSKVMPGDRLVELYERS